MNTNFLVYNLTLMQTSANSLGAGVVLLQVKPWLAMVASRNRVPVQDLGTLLPIGSLKMNWGI